MSDNAPTTTHTLAQERDEFVRENFVPLMWSLVARGASPQDAADITQKAMIRTWQTWPHSSPHAFVRKIARDALVDMNRKTSAGLKLHDRLCALYDRTPAPAADTTVLFDAETTTVLGLINELPDRQREVIVHTMDGLCLEEIADLTGRKITTVRSNLRHARTKLRLLIRDRKE